MVYSRRLAKFVTRQRIIIACLFQRVREKRDYSELYYLANIFLPWGEHTHAGHLKRADVMRTIMHEQMVSQFASLLLVRVNLVASTAVRQSAVKG